MKEKYECTKKQKIKERGITLIALVITIIVLLILAGVALSTLTGDSGILTNAEKAKAKTEQANLKEEVSLKVIEDELDTENKLTLKQYLNQISNAEVTPIGEDTFLVTRNKATVTVYETGEVIEGNALWDGETSESPEIEKVNGIFNWYIYTPAQLKFLADYVNNENSLTTEQVPLLTEAGYTTDDVGMSTETIVYLMNDLDLGAREVNGEWENVTVDEDEDKTNENFEWEPIGNYKKSNACKFIATFEGNGKTIRGVYVNTETVFNGIFGYANSIKNLTIKDSYIQGAACIGGIAGAIQNGSIENCHNIDTTVRLIQGEYNSVGGVVGQAVGTVLNCSNTGKIVAIGSTADGRAQAGGVVGTIYQSYTVSNCYNTGKVISNGECTGGVVGLANTSTTVSNCYNTGAVIGKESDTGGIVGAMASEEGVTNSTVEKCYNSGNVEGNALTAGIVGAVSGTGTVKECYNKGQVEGTTYVGSIIGFTGGLNNILKHLYYLDTVGIGAINDEDNESNNIMSTTENITSYKQFLQWIQGKSQI